MKSVVCAAILVLSCVSLAGQGPRPKTAKAPFRTFTNLLGFSYSLPADWEVNSSETTLPQVKQKAAENATGEEEKKGVECVQIGLSARHGSPPSVITEMTLPFDCFGQQVSEDDLPGFANGAMENIRQNFIADPPVTGRYTLGTHNMWIQRMKGFPKGQPGSPFTVEIACTLVQKAAVCWMTMAADDASLAVFEHGAVTLDGEPPVALVPATAFQKQTP
jgi:hypothetical protein